MVGGKEFCSIEKREFFALKGGDGRRRWVVGGLIFLIFFLAIGGLIFDDDGLLAILEHIPYFGGAKFPFMVFK